LALDSHSERVSGDGVASLPEMKIRSFEEIAIGETGELSRIILQSDVDRFAGLTGDDNPLHVNSEFARQTTFKEPVVHGMLAGSLVSTLIGTQLPGPGALWVKQEFRFLGPVRVNDNLNVKVVVIAKHARDRTIDIEVEATVSGRGAVLKGKGLVMMLNLDISNDQQSSSEPVQKALITGATGEIGSAIARTLSAKGFHIIAHSNRNHQKALALQEEIVNTGGECDVFQCDLSNIENVKKFAADIVGRFGVVDTLILNASGNIDQTDILSTQVLNINESLAINLLSSLTLIQEFVPGMVEQNWGRIIGVSSDAVHVQPNKGWFTYTVGKTALESLIQQSAIELGHKGITSNIVAPGMTDTSFVSNIPARARQVVAQTTPNRRLATTIDVANAIAFLCDSNSGHVNGQTLRINGGIGV
jgi:3-oxoacyl-[acyl-carrier protein] reductase